MKTAVWVTLFIACSAGALVLADRVAGSVWALPFGVAIVAAAFSVDRLTESLL